MKQFQRALLVISIAVTSACGFAGPSIAETRIALVIGNGKYQNAPRLPNPANDASDVAAALTRTGFDIILATELTRDGMQEAAIRFSRAARTADVAMFYYSGHAIQFAGINYLIPVDAELKDEADLRRMVRVDEIVADLQQAKNLRILVLDSCRDNPLAEQLKRSIGATRSLPLQRGLAKIDSPQGMIISYATQAGRTAEDGSGRNSPYTSAFLKNIEAREEIGTIFRRISADVFESTQRQQLPELSLSLIGEFYLRGKVEVDAKSAPAGSQNTLKEDFEAAERVDTVGGWDAFLAQHPTGFYSSLARERRAKAGARVAVAPAAPNSRIEVTRTEAEPAKPSPPGGVVFPRAIDPKYAGEGEARARMHTCVDQYNANKANNANGGMKWIEKGGGYYTKCTKRLKGA